MKLFVLSAAHNITSYRKEVYELFLTRMAHIRSKYSVEMLVVGSEGEASRSMTEDAGFLYLEHPDNPLSEKWNVGLRALKKHKLTHVMVLGSDDFISDSLLECYLMEIERGYNGIIGIMDSYFISLSEKAADFNQCIYWQGYPSENILGSARCMPRWVLDKVGWELWPKNENSGLDRHAKMKMMRLGVSGPVLGFSIKEEGWLHLDIKTRGNVSSMSPLMKRATPVDFEGLIRDNLPKGESDNIISYRETILNGVK